MLSQLPSPHSSLERSGWVVEGVRLILPQRQRIPQIECSDLRQFLINEGKKIHRRVRNNLTPRQQRGLFSVKGIVWIL